MVTDGRIPWVVRLCVLVHFNGQFIPRDRVRVDPFDRGFLLGDGLYEGLRAFDGHVVGMGLHVERLRAGLEESRIPWDARRLAALTDELLAANSLRDAFIYWQVTRGVPASGQPLRARVPTGDVTPTVFGYCLPTPALESYTGPLTKTAITARDTRWLRGRVKSISLLGNVIASLEAAEAGADDAILIRDGVVAEGSSANLFADVPDGRGGWTAVTPSLESVPILAGVTRDLVLAGERAAGRPIEERSVSADELTRAREVILLGTLTMVTSITALNGSAVGDGRPGPLANRLMSTLARQIRSEQNSRARSGRAAQIPERV